MRKIITLILILTTITTKYGFSYSPSSGNYFSIGIGYLLKQGNPILDEDIVIFQISDGIKFSERLSGNINFSISFPDERITFLRLKTFGNLSLYNLDWIIKLSIFLNTGFENISYFVNMKITNEIPFKYYAIFMPYISGGITLSTKIILEIFGGFDIIGGVPFLFLPNTQPFIAGTTLFNTYQIGIRNFILDEISIYYDQITFSIFLTKRF